MMGETETMLKIFLAEDEIVMREGIRNNIAWQEEGFEFVGEASDGELAYPMIQKLKPDILITDIRMPFMDGLELSRIVKQELPDTSILILSGYGEFDYAKEAISIGVEDYLLKPVTSAQLLEAIRRIAEKIYGRRGRQEETKNEKEQKTLTKRRLFRHIVSGEHSFSEVLKEAREQEIELAAERYNVLMLQLFFEDGTETEKGYEVAVDLPGFKKDEIQLELNDGYLTISAEKGLDKEEKDKKDKYIRRERYAGSMSRTFYVGESVTENDIHAKYENGILTLDVPKEEAKKVPEKRYISIEG